MNEKTIAFEKILSARGYKLTSQRLEVLRIISNEKERHLCTEEIFDEAKTNDSGIGLATVYRTLKLFEQLGFVHCILLNDGCMRYQMIEFRDKSQHPHLICEVCGEIIDVDENMLESLEKKLLLEKGFIVKNHKVQLLGICKKCADRGVN